MKDIQKREKGKYIEEGENYIEETVIGNNYEIISFSRGYNPPLAFIPTPGVHVNKYSTKIKKETVTIIETTTVDENNKVIDFVKEII